MQVLGGLDGDPDLFRALMTFGGAATFLSAGLASEEWVDRRPEQIAARVDELAPDFRSTLLTFAPYARWRDALFVHGGPVPFQDLDEFGRSAARLWIWDGFFASRDLFPVARPWAPYRSAGIARVVFGHTPVERPTLSHEDRALNLDTWRGHEVSLARIEGEGHLRDAALLAAPAQPRALPDAPVTADDVRRYDAALPGVVDRWAAAVNDRSLGTRLRR